MALTFLEQRYCPLPQNTVNILDDDENDSKVKAVTCRGSRRRSFSIGGYIPYMWREEQGRPSPSPRSYIVTEMDRDDEKRAGATLTSATIPLPVAASMPLHAHIDLVINTPSEEDQSASVDDSVHDLKDLDGPTASGSIGDVSTFADSGSTGASLPSDPGFSCDSSWPVPPPCDPPWSIAGKQEEEEEAPPSWSPSLMKKGMLTTFAPSLQAAAYSRMMSFEEQPQYAGFCEGNWGSVTEWPDTDSEGSACNQGRSIISLDACIDMSVGQPQKGGDSSMQLDEGTDRTMATPPLDDLQAEVRATRTQERVTTLMIRNLPLAVNQSDLLQELDKTGFAGLYDFCYAPSCFISGETKGFAFVNMITEEDATAFVNSWHASRHWSMKEREPALNISIASLQGLEANVVKWSAPRMKRIRNPNFRPFVAYEKTPRTARETTTADHEPEVTMRGPQPGGRQHPGAHCGARQHPAGAAPPTDVLPVGQLSCGARVPSKSTANQRHGRRVEASRFVTAPCGITDRQRTC
eukprot:gnl/TRDRNA2_/TRDRNA2_177261_c0_seq3.p1 gnl/TRDRNA2_/TRDRNA2_177261_c0~~gnl/TRDRNA2_/TRDRNA2_177261_c0_seq3.p1  ORF type:complete len:522 (+),score=90.24 gnl/TRDRNA2_/TRDRNA2_177261_c0_seq3:59-1624(+)